MTPVKDPQVIPIKQLDGPPRCADFDEDCVHVPCKTTCWLHAPEEGYCPYLQHENN